MRVLVVDDEEVARARLRVMLGAMPGVAAVAECGDGADAVSVIRETPPDLVILDIAMPELGGIEVVRLLGPRRMPPVVFVTAYDEFAVAAFDLEAVDYLLKPVERPRLERAVERARLALTARARRSAAARLLQAVERFPRGEWLRHVEVPRRGTTVLVPVEEIRWIEAEDNYVRIHQPGRTDLVRGKITAFEARLDPQLFARVHRSALVNLRHVRGLRRSPPLAVVLRDGGELRVSDSYRGELLSRLRHGSSFRSG